MKEQPNIVIIYTDQQSSWTLGCYGGSLIETPHIDSLAKDGVRFTNYFTNCAVCTPSRGCMMTGKYNHFHGAYRNHVPLNPDVKTIGHLMKQGGYETAYIGKWHLDGAPSPGWAKPEGAWGFDDSKYMFNRGHNKQVIEQENGPPEMTKDIGDENTYMTDWIASKTIDYITQPHEKPFFVIASIPDPHNPYSVRSPYDNMYKPEDMPIPDTFYEENLPDWAENDRWSRKEQMFAIQIDRQTREEKLRQAKAQYCGEVKCIDDNVGKILAALDQQGLRDNTIVIFTTDHGEYMGEHGLAGKNLLYETAYHIPFIMRWPGKIKAEQVLDRFISVVDVVPTLLGLVGLDQPSDVQGKDASPLILGEDIPWADEAFIHPVNSPRTGIFTPDFELAFVGKSYDGKTQFRDHVLFDRRNDPDQVNNLYFKREYAKVIDELAARIAAHHQALGMDPRVLPDMIAERMDAKAAQQ